MMQALLTTAIDLTERGVIPDRVVRLGIQQMCRQRLREEQRAYGADLPGRRAALRRDMDASPIALMPATANDQHYEAPVELFQRALGPRLKYSCGF